MIQIHVTVVQRIQHGRHLSGRVSQRQSFYKCFYSCAVMFPCVYRIMWCGGAAGCGSRALLLMSEVVLEEPQLCLISWKRSVGFSALLGLMVNMNTLENKCSILTVAKLIKLKGPFYDVI